ncbi:MAG: aminotransferase class I/II-fold pyridoxal phosphate-dependent enzyme [Bacteroidales bacterium]|nr:aminotransferase class I/II-fold pyridoxal phosphate-dependent enzyme [Bacteroidales bacterium]
MTQYRFETLQVHAGHTPDPTTGACATPVYQTAAYAFQNVEHGRRLFALEEPGNIYSRINNPTVETFEKRIAALENGAAAVAVSSGMSAQFLAIVNLCDAGDNIISSLSLYGGTYNQFKVTLPRLGITTKFCKCQNEEEIEALIDEKTKGVYVETIANSDLSVPDFDLLHKVCKKHNLPLIVDNTVGCGGYLCAPADWGADIITHSATKWIGGHGNSIAGIVVDAGKFDWACGRFPQFTQPAAAYKGLSYSEYFGKTAFAVRARSEMLRDYGCCLSPFNAFLLLTGVETLSLRAQRVCDNALALAKWLEAHPKVEKVNYPGLESHPAHANAKKYLRNGFGGIITVDLKASRQDTAAFVDQLKIFTLLANLGDNKSLVAHPATTTHAQLTDQELLNVGIKPGTLRLCIGIENIEDIIADFEQAMKVL